MLAASEVVVVITLIVGTILIIMFIFNAAITVVSGGLCLAVWGIYKIICKANRNGK